MNELEERYRGFIIKKKRRSNFENTYWTIRNPRNYHEVHTDRGYDNAKDIINCALNILKYNTSRKKNMFVRNKAMSLIGNKVYSR